MEKLLFSSLSSKRTGPICRILDLSYCPLTDRFLPSPLLHCGWGCLEPSFLSCLKWYGPMPHFSLVINLFHLWAALLQFMLQAVKLCRGGGRANLWKSKHCLCKPVWGLNHRKLTKPSSTSNPGLSTQLFTAFRADEGLLQYTEFKDLK